MLKKNLHFFIRSVILLSLFTIILLFASCNPHEENYLAFLDGDLSFYCNIEHKGSKIADARILKRNETITVTFTSPSSLKGTVLRITPENAEIEHAGKPLSQAAIPGLWLEIGQLLENDKKIVAITYNNGLTEIHTENESGAFDYKTDDEGRLISIENGNIRITVKEES